MLTCVHSKKMIVRPVYLALFRYSIHTISTQHLPSVHLTPRSIASLALPQMNEMLLPPPSRGSSYTPDTWDPINRRINVSCKPLSNLMTIQRDTSHQCDLAAPSYHDARIVHGIMLHLLATGCRASFGRPGDDRSKNSLYPCWDRWSLSTRKKINKYVILSCIQGYMCKDLSGPHA